MISALHRMLTGAPIVFKDEDELQRIVDNNLRLLGWRFAREFNLSRASRVDFMVLPLPGLAIEVKTTGGLNAILRQLKRYSEFESVSEVVLISPKPYQLPATLTGKPCHCIPLYTAML